MTLQPCGGAGSRGGSRGSKGGVTPARCSRGLKWYAFGEWAVVRAVRRAREEIVRVGEYIVKGFGMELESFTSVLVGIHNWEN